MSLSKILQSNLKAFHEQPNNLIWVYLKCLKPCKHITYTGSSLELAEATLLETSNTQAIFQMIVHDIRRVQKERLYYDTFDMIGAIGGSLGLFLGFSFFDGICKCMDKLTHLIKYLSGRELEVIEPGCGIRKVTFEFVKE